VGSGQWTVGSYLLLAVRNSKADYEEKEKGELNGDI
jgi:hypothetical protein